MVRSVLIRVRLRWSSMAPYAGRLGCGLCAFGLLGCEPKLDVGTWTGRSRPPPAPTLPTAPLEPEPAPPAMEGGGGPVEAGLAIVEAGLSNEAGPAPVEPEPLAACEESLDAGRPADELGAGAWMGPLALPWSTSFEDGLCAFADAQGYCYADSDASYEVVTSPVRTGGFAAAFHVTSDDALAGTQARCVRRGTFPVSAVYGAWFFVPATAQNAGNWNLFHLQGADDAGNLHGLWDVSLGNGPGDGLHLYVFDFLNGQFRDEPEPRAVPIGQWFQVELLWRRATDETGEIALFQDGQRLFQAVDIRTDDSQWGQWYVGNLADNLTPPGSTVYVDDVTITEAP